MEIVIKVKLIIIPLRTQARSGMWKYPEKPCIIVLTSFTILCHIIKPYYTNIIGFLFEFCIYERSRRAGQLKTI